MAGPRTQRLRFLGKMTPKWGLAPLSRFHSRVNRAGALGPSPTATCSLPEGQHPVEGASFFYTLSTEHTEIQRRKNMTKKESRICNNCHEATEKRTAFIEKSLSSVKCPPISDRKCFQCHMKKCSSQRPFFFSEDTIAICSACHKKQHDVTHPVGPGVIDPRNGQMVTCTSCHSMHSAKADYLLTYNRKRALCIQCHKK
jgi:predicted CXXCH cytochrome family protein